MLSSEKKNWQKKNNKTMLTDNLIHIVVSVSSLNHGVVIYSSPWNLPEWTKETKDALTVNIAPKRLLSGKVFDRYRLLVGLCMIDRYFRYPLTSISSRTVYIWSNTANHPNLQIFALKHFSFLTALLSTPRKERSWSGWASPSHHGHDLPLHQPLNTDLIFSIFSDFIPTWISCNWN